ncbi:MAG: ATP-binding protein [Bacteroidales bacterium]|nr:ATP-binding protein [Bacteroidales bacterium]
MKRAFSNRDLQRRQFDAAPFDGVWRSAIGRPELHGSWIIYGGSGSGKTTFALQLAKYLTRFGRVAYDTLEQGLSLSFQRAWLMAGMDEAGNRVVVLDREPMADLRERLARRKSPDIVIIDSLTCLPGFGKVEYMQMMRTYSQKLFIFLAHERQGRPDPAIAETVRRLSEVKMRVEGFKVFTVSRYTVPERQEGIDEYIVWPEGADGYWNNRIINTTKS